MLTFFQVSGIKYTFFDKRSLMLSLPYKNKLNEIPLKSFLSEIV
jgi:hypothetical protein